MRIKYRTGCQEMERGKEGSRRNLDMGPGHSGWERKLPWKIGVLLEDAVVAQRCL